MPTGSRESVLRPSRRERAQDDSGKVRGICFRDTEEDAMRNLRAHARFFGASMLTLAVVVSCTQPSTQTGASPSASAAADTNKTFVYGMPQNAVGASDGPQIVV